MGKKKKIRNKNSRKSMREMPSGIISLYPDLFVVRVGLRALGFYVSQKKPIGIWCSVDLLSNYTNE